MLIDLAGLRAAGGPLLARRPARRRSRRLRISARRNVVPLVDRVVPTLGELATSARQDAKRASAVRRRCRTPRRWPRSGKPRCGRTSKASWPPRANGTPACSRCSRATRPRTTCSASCCATAARSEGARAEFASALAAAPGLRRRASRRGQGGAVGGRRAMRGRASAPRAWRTAPQPLPLFRALGLALLAQHDGAGAADAFARALAIDPADGETHYNRGVALQMQHRAADAARAYQHALAFRPDLTAADFNLGALFQRARRGRRARSLAYENVLKAEPDERRRVSRISAKCCSAPGGSTAWLANFRRFEASCPDALALAVQALEACQHRGDFARRRPLSRRACAPSASGAGDALELCDNLEQLLYLLLFFDVEPAVIFRFAQTYDATARRVYGAPLARPADAPARAHAHRLSRRRPAQSRDGQDDVAGGAAPRPLALLPPLLFAVERARRRGPNASRGSPIASTVLADLPEREAARRIAADDLDLLVDLSTHTRGAKPGILALKPARVQITHVASAGTVGLSTVDFKLTDRHADLAESQAIQIETLLPMDGCVYPYRHIAPAAAHPFRRSALGGRRGRRADRRLRRAAQAFAPLSRALARGARADSARAARLLADEPRVPRLVLRGSPRRRASHPTGCCSCRRGATTPRTRRATSSSTSCSTRCLSAASTARWRRSTWAFRS